MARVQDAFSFGSFCETVLGPESQVGPAARAASAGPSHCLAGGPSHPSHPSHEFRQPTAGAGSPTGYWFRLTSTWLPPGRPTVTQWLQCSLTVLRGRAAAAPGPGRRPSTVMVTRTATSEAPSLHSETYTSYD